MINHTNTCGKYGDTESNKKQQESTVLERVQPRGAHKRKVRDGFGVYVHGLQDQRSSYSKRERGSIAKPMPKILQDELIMVHEEATLASLHGSMVQGVSVFSLFRDWVISRLVVVVHKS